MINFGQTRDKAMKLMDWFGADDAISPADAVTVLSLTLATIILTTNPDVSVQRKLELIIDLLVSDIQMITLNKETHDAAERSDERRTNLDS